MKHLRVFVNLGFWKPCVKAVNLNESQLQTIELLDSALSAAFPIIGQVLILEVTDVNAPRVSAVTLSSVHTGS